MLFDFLNKEGLAYLINKILKRDVDLTQAEYDALPESKNSDGKNYYIYDSDITVTAEEVGFDGSTSGSSAANSQQALDELFAANKGINENLGKTVQDSFICNGTMKASLLALDDSYHVVSGELNSSLISDVPNYPNDAWFYFTATRIGGNSWDIELSQFGSVKQYKGHLYYGNDINWDELATNSDLSPSNGGYSSSITWNQYKSRAEVYIELSNYILNNYNISVNAVNIAGVINITSDYATSIISKNALCITLPESIQIERIGYVTFVDLSFTKK